MAWPAPVAPRPMIAASAATAAGVARDVVGIDRRAVAKRAGVSGIGVGVAPQRRQAARGPYQRPVAHSGAPGAATAEGAAVGDDDAGIDARQLGVAESQRFQRAGFEVRGHDVGVGDQLAKQPGAVGTAQVETEPAFVAMTPCEGGVHSAAFTGLAQAVGESGVLDFDDVGAVVCEQSAKFGAEYDHAQIEHSQTGQRRGSRLAVAAARGRDRVGSSGQCSVGGGARRAAARADGVRRARRR